MSEAILRGKEALCGYIPQREPIVMVDMLYEVSADDAKTGLTVDGECFLVKDGMLLDGGMVEHIAQSEALHIGYEAVNSGKAVPIGLIGSVNKLKIYRRPKVGEEMQTTLHVEARVGDVTLVSAVVRVGDETIAETKMKLATPASE